MNLSREAQDHRTLVANRMRAAMHENIGKRAFTDWGHKRFNQIVLRACRANGCHPEGIEKLREIQQS